MSIESPIYCEHANECPSYCRCPSDCYCRTQRCTNILSLDELRELIKACSPVSEDQKLEQEISWVWGQVNFGRNPEDYISKEKIREIVKALKDVERKDDSRR